MKVKEFKKKLKEMNDLELEKKLSDTKEELFNLRFQLATGHLNNHSRINQVKKEIARIKTTQKEKEYAAQSLV